MRSQTLTLRQKLSNPNIWLVLILLLAGALRLYDLTDEPLELHPTRQFRALIIARSFYYPTAEDIPAEQVEFAEQQASLVGLIEPSVLEYLTAQLYKVAGQEITWLGRVFSISAWLLGGLAVYALGKHIGSTWSAFIGLVYYLFLPFGVQLSRVLMVDPIMVAGISASLWALAAWSKTKNVKYAILAGLLTGITIFLKSVAGIILIVPFALFLLGSFSIKDLLKDRQVWLILLLAALPTVAYYYWGLVIDGRLATQFKGRFFPEIWTDIIFYKSWGLRIIQEFNLVAFLIGLAGILLAKTKPVRLMLFGWWAGYFIYAMLFAYYTWTHDYYHLPMVPLVAVSMVPVFSYLENLAKKGNRAIWYQAGAAVLCVGIAVFGSYHVVQFLAAENYRNFRTDLEEVGGLIESLPTGKIIALTDDYETSFTFYTFLKAEHWPSLGDMNFQELQGSSAQAFERLWQDTEDAAYFLVTDFRELGKQPQLEERLSEMTLIAEDETYRLYSLDGNMP